MREGIGRQRWLVWGLLATMTLLLVVLLLLGCANQRRNPPSIPHRAYEELCVSCHRTGKGGAPVQPHPNWGSCTGCHQYRR